MSEGAEIRPALEADLGRCQVAAGNYRALRLRWSCGPD
jgi:hypothetical protein